MATALTALGSVLRPVPLTRGVSMSKGRPSIVALRCSRCNHKVDAAEGMQLFLRRHLPDAGVMARDSLRFTNWGTKKQVGIYDLGRVAPPSRQVRDLLVGGKVGCPRCGAVDWRTDA
eukprot:TRINITY_DN42988_c0_g1_i1.p1 TRINITY_DN42988_c0_g1~~TRINITY_DN42988_c0_g1_i1.p1  ORF type:complete len:117 (+),score=14.12 TRINITY_DN42988_c0_g1_i1:78-428(+)